MSAVDHVVEAERHTPVIARADDTVVGSGPAGIIAAIASARTGADTLLIERYDYVGGYFANQPGGQSVGVQPR
jgi:NADPH-dependent 2,4-dienoyl-CoA reductase/sulfur reductase-like enzyme